MNSLNKINFVKSLNVFEDISNYEKLSEVVKSEAHVVDELLSFKQKSLPMSAFSLLKFNIEGQLRSFYPLIIEIDDNCTDIMNLLVKGEWDKFYFGDNNCKIKVDRKTLSFLEVDLVDYCKSFNNPIEVEWRTKTIGKSWFGRISLLSCESDFKRNIFIINYRIMEIKSDEG